MIMIDILPASVLELSRTCGTS